MKVGPIEKDARVLDQPGDDLAVLLHPGRPQATLGLELPLVRGEALGRLFHSPLVLLVGEVRPVAATSLDEFGGGLGQDALAARPEDALPIALQERDVEHPGALTLGVFKTDPLVGV